MAGDVIRLVPRDERERERFAELAHHDAEALIETARGLVAEAVAEGRKVVGLAVAVAFSDGSYGSLIPVNACDYGRLLGAVADLQFRLLRNTNE